MAKLQLIVEVPDSWFPAYEDREGDEAELAAGTLQDALDSHFLTSRSCRLTLLRAPELGYAWLLPEAAREPETRSIPGPPA